MLAYLDVVRYVLEHGTRKENRTGVDTLSSFNYNYSVNVADGFPLLTTKEISWKNIVVENLWFLSGQTDIHLLWKHNCKFWDPWADPETGTVPSAYGHFWRNFATPEGDNDQVRYVVNTLKDAPMSRRMVVAAWHPMNAQTSDLPPCHAFWVVNVQNDHNGTPRICLHLTQRSCDIALGLPYNIAGYALIMHLLSRFSGIEVGEFGHSLVDAHIYTAKADGSMAEYDHIPGLNTQLERQPKALPRLVIDSSITSLEDIPALLELETDELMALFTLEGYDPHPAIKFKVAV